MAAPTEKQLDAALEQAFKENAEFTQWFLSKTKIAARTTKYSWSRSDHPWGTIRYTSINAETGATETCDKECETDVLVILQAEDGEVLALHIENKIGSGKFTALQPEMYAPRAEQWKGKSKYRNYTDFDTVLVAPRKFRERNEPQAKLFGCLISHEDIAQFIPLFGQVSDK